MIQDIESIVKATGIKDNTIGMASITIGSRVYGILVVTESGSLLKRKAIKINNSRIPVIVVSKTLFLGDAYYDVVGDYIVSYLLFPLEIIRDEGLLNKTIVDVRRRIVDEEVSILASYGKILSYAIIPIEYFPIKALSIRVKLYNSLKTISKNILQTIGFSKVRLIFREVYRDVINYIVEKNRLELVDQHHVKLTIKVLLEPSYKKYIPRIKEKISPIAMSITSFLMDERVPRQAQDNIPVEFVKPHIMIKMREGDLGLGDWRELVEKKYGVLEKEGKTSIVYATEIYRAGNRRIVVKQYTSPSSIKWVLASIASILSKKFIVNSWERQYNEYHASILLASKKILHRRVLIVDPISAVTVFEYVEGDPIIELAKKNDDSSRIAYQLTGRLLGKLHINGIVMGDTKPDNYILSIEDGEPIIVPIDLEQVRETRSIEERAWDIAMFVYFHGMGHSRVPNHYMELIKLFLKEYLSIVGDNNVLVEAGKIRYQLPFMYIVPAHNLIQLNNILKNVVG